MDLEEYIQEQTNFSRKTFGEGKRTEGICKHIEKELNEIRQSPEDVFEWVDVIILALDGAWRAGHTPDEICNALNQKQKINLAREWPEPNDDETCPIEHIK